MADGEKATLLYLLHEPKERSAVHDGRSLSALGTLIKNTERKLGSSVRS